MFLVSRHLQIELIALENMRKSDSPVHRVFEETLRFSKPHGMYVKLGLFLTNLLDCGIIDFVD